MNTQLNTQTLLGFINAGYVPLDLYDIDDIKQQSYNAKKYIGFDSHINTNYACKVHYLLNNDKTISINFKTYDDYYTFTNRILSTIQTVHNKSYIEVLTNILDFNFDNIRNALNVLKNCEQSLETDQLLDLQTVAKHTRAFPEYIRNFIWNNRTNLSNII